MNEIKYYNEDDLNKFHRNEYGLTDEFVREEYANGNCGKVFNTNINSYDCSVKAYCIDSIPPFCRVRREWSLREESPFKYVGSHTIANAYRQFELTHLKVAWGVCAYFLYTKRIDEQGHKRYEWSEKVRGLGKCRQHYFDISYNIHKAQHRDEYGYYEENDIVDEFKAAFAKCHIESERDLIERTVNTRDLFEEYDNLLGIKQEADEYLGWVRSTYLLSQTKATKTIDRDESLLALFNKNEAIYDKFFERCRGKENVEIVNEILAVIGVLYKGGLKEATKEYTYKSIRKHLKNNGLNVKEYSAFVYAFEYASKRNSEERKAKIENAKKEYQKLLPQKLQDITTFTTFAL